MAILSTERSTSLGELQNATTWSLTILTGAAVVVGLQQDFPNSVSMVGLSAIFVLGTHFGVRAAKGYINVIRWAHIQRRILGAVTGEVSKDDVFEAIETYHIKWKSPITRWDLIRKCLFELGYFYILFGLMAAIAFGFFSSTVSNASRLVVIIAVGLASYEVSVFFDSAYMDVEPDDEARKLR